MSSLGPTPRAAQRAGVAVSVLFVCTGNICRSPVAERLFAAGLRERLGPVADAVVVGSAGTWGLEGSTMEPFAASALRELGGSDAGFRARELTEDVVHGADVVLCATREHRACAVTLVPRVIGRTFTILEFSRLCSTVSVAELPVSPLPARAAALVLAAARARGRCRPAYAEDDDLPDPIGAPASVFTTSARQIAAALAVPLDLLAGIAPA